MSSQTIQRDVRPDGRLQGSGVDGASLPAWGLRYWYVALLLGLITSAGAFLGPDERDIVLHPVRSQMERVKLKLATIDAYSRKEVNTGMHRITVEAYQLPFPDSGPTGPFLALSNTEFLVATKKGNLHHVVLRNEKADATLIGSLGVSENLPRFAGVKGLLLVAPHVLLVSMNTWNDQANCFALGLFEFSLDIGQHSLKRGRKLFESQPCIPPDVGAHLSGGRMVRLPGDSILLTIGNFDNESLTDGRKTDLARIYKINLRDGQSTVYAMGTRNATGLYLDPESGLVFETEHGPRGGDEVNLIRQGKHYGWPFVTYGTPYSNPYDPALLTQSVTKYGSHAGYEEPLVAFVPDIGINNIIRYPTHGTEFPGWQGNLLVGSLVARTLYRMKYLEGRIIFSEPILLDERLRDIALLENESVAIKTDSQKLLVLTRATAAGG